MQYIIFKYVMLVLNKSVVKFLMSGHACAYETGLYLHGYSTSTWLLHIIRHPEQHFNMPNKRFSPYIWYQNCFEYSIDYLYNIGNCKILICRSYREREISRIWIFYIDVKKILIMSILFRLTCSLPVCKLRYCIYE